MTLTLQEVHLKGTPICQGVAIGHLHFIETFEESVIERSITDIEAEVKRYRFALETCHLDLMRLKNRLETENAFDGAAILEAHIHMLADPLLTEEVEKRIRQKKKNAEFIFQKVIEECSKRFKQIPDPFFQERYQDVLDISRRVMRYLAKKKSPEIPKNSIIFATELSASFVAESNLDKVKAFITETGGMASHAAIVARAKGIPFISNMKPEDVEDFEGAPTILDGSSGDIFFHPSASLIDHYEQKLEYHSQNLRIIQERGHLPATTYDGYTVRLSANIDVDHELELLHQYGGHGVGLFRSEYLFLAHDTYPTEEEQYAIYKNVVDKMRGLPIVIRTFDVGGDKFGGPEHPLENNPFLGCRAIRLFLKEREVFKSQLRAILRAAQHGEVNLMFPMISTLAELREAKAILEEAKVELNFTKLIRIGCMIEVPSAALIADMLVQECDFLSIGTNDLVQYSVAVDRGNHTLNHLYRPTHPGVLRLIKMVVGEANRYGVSVSVCGEMAADPKYTALLLGLGIQELSVAPRHLPVIKNAIRHLSIVDAVEHANYMLRGIG